MAVPKGTAVASAQISAIQKFMKDHPELLNYPNDYWEGMFNGGLFPGTVQQAPPPRFHESEIVSESPLHERAHSAIGALTKQLPMRILGAIEKVKLLATVDSVANMQGNFRYVVEFKGGRKLEFANADTFPTEADVARVALECP